MGKDEDFVEFMKTKNYSLLLYYDGDYTFVKNSSDLCQKYCRNLKNLLHGFTS